jgi:heme/copper-type cytochrome/quinol oxidase subunit 4
MLGNVLFQTGIAVVGALAIPPLALLYFRRVRLERPSIGAFNGRDVAVLAAFIVLLPVLYVTLPQRVLIGFLTVTFVSALYIGLRPLLPVPAILSLAAVLITADILVTQHMLGTERGWQMYWLLNSTLVILAVVGVSNLYLQGGMRLRHIAWLALFLAFYDITFTIIIPLTPQLADTFEGQPLDAAFGFYMGGRQANLGIGDILLYALVMVGAYKAYGRRAAWGVLPLIGIFGGLLPGLSPLAIQHFVREGIGIAVPAQVFFGPVAFAAYHWLHRHYGPERSTGEWFAVQDAAGRAPARQRRRARPATQPAP